MKLEVGMYVRTKEGIAKVIEKRKNPYGEETIFQIDKSFIYHFMDFFHTSEDMVDINFEEDTNQIKKASHNIIDLIEVGDYVDGEKVIQTNCNVLYYDEDSGNEIDIYNALETTGSWVYFDSEITSIVTKEQFEAMQYEIK